MFTPPDGAIQIVIDADESGNAIPEFAAWAFADSRTCPDGKPGFSCLTGRYAGQLLCGCHARVIE
jgi:hypothetical protein